MNYSFPVSSVFEDKHKGLYIRYSKSTINNLKNKGHLLSAANPVELARMF